MSVQRRLVNVVFACFARCHTTASQCVPFKHISLEWLPIAMALTYAGAGLELAAYLVDREKSMARPRQA